MANRQNVLRDRQRRIVAGGDSWANVAMLYGGARAAGTIVDANKELQRAQLHLKGLNLTNGAQNKFGLGITNEELANALVSQLLKTPNTVLTKAQATEAVYHATSAFGHFDYQRMRRVLPDLVKTAQATKFGGYSTDEMGDIIRNYIGVIEARQQVNDVEAMKKTIQTIWKTQALTGGKIGPKDLEVIFRNLGSGASTISDEGLMGLIAIAEQSKPSGGGSSGGAGSGVASVGTIVKMVQLMAAGKPVALGAKKSLYEAGIIATPDDDKVKQVNASMDNFKKIIDSISIDDLKKAGFTNKNQIWSDPIKGIAQMRPILLEYMLSNVKNISRYFGTKSRDDENKFYLTKQYAATGNATVKEIYRLQNEQKRSLAFLSGLKLDDLMYQGVLTGGKMVAYKDIKNEELRAQIRQQFNTQKRFSEKEAFNTLFATMGFSHRVVAGMSMMTDADFLKRYQHTVESAQNVKNADEMLKIFKESNSIEYAMLNFNASLTRVYESFQPLVEQAAKFINILSDGLKVASEFFSQNSGITGWTVIAGGIAFATRGMLAFVGAINNAVNGSIQLKNQLVEVGLKIEQNNAALLASMNKQKTHRKNAPQRVAHLNSNYDDSTSRRLRIRADEANANVDARVAAPIGSNPRDASNQQAIERARQLAQQGRNVSSAWAGFMYIPNIFAESFNKIVNSCEKAVATITGFFTKLLAKVGAVASGIGIAFLAVDIAGILWEWAKKSEFFMTQLEKIRKALNIENNGEAYNTIVEKQDAKNRNRSEELANRQEYLKLQKNNQIPVWFGNDGATWVEETVDPTKPMVRPG